MRIPLDKFRRIIYPYLKNTDMNTSFNLEFVDGDFIMTGDWEHVPKEAHMKFAPGIGSSIPFYLFNHSIVAMSLEYKGQQKFISFSSLDYVPTSRFIYMIFCEIFELSNQ